MSLASNCRKKFVIVAGTWEFDGNDSQSEWWLNDSAFVKFMAQNGFDYVQKGGDGFVWTTSLEGVDIFRYFGKKPKHASWRAAAKNLKQYLLEIPLEDRNIIAHSHGGQVVAYCLAEGVEINNLITVAMPVRSDMKDVYTKASMYTNHWLHVHSNWTDFMQIFGALFDGHIGVHRTCTQADKNIVINGVGHSKIVREPEYFPMWNSYGLLNYL